MNTWHDIFEYDPATGLLYWGISPNPSIKIGAKAGCHHKRTGYIHVAFNRKSYLAHRIIWEIHNTPIPKGMEIDHINHIKTDNKLSNLRIVNHQTNGKNQRLRATNTTGANGVNIHKGTGKFRAYITLDGKPKHIGLFDNINDATAARVAAEVKHGFHVNHGLQSAGI